MENGFNRSVTEPQNIEIFTDYLTSWLQRHAAAFSRKLDADKKSEHIKKVAEMSFNPIEQDL